MVERQFQQIYYKLFMKDGYIFRRFHYTRELIAATEKAHLPILSLVLGIKCFSETGHLKIPEISEKRSRINKAVIQV